MPAKPSTAALLRPLPYCDAKKISSFHVVPAILDRGPIHCDGYGGQRRGRYQTQLLGRGIEEPAQQLRIRSPGMGHATLPAADQAPGNPELPLAMLDAQSHQLTD